MPGVRDASEAVKSKECSSTEKTISVNISTRQIGFELMKLLNTITSDEKIARSIEHNRGNQYQWYRVSHALVEAKLALTMRKNELYR